MPSITINEIDNTIVQETTSITNTVLVMGGSTFGPTEEPTLLKSFSDLSIFGGSVENNYAYKTAKNILRLGYPVLFTRVAPDEESSSLAHFYGTKSMADASLEDYTIFDNIDYGYKVSTVGTPTSTTVEEDGGNIIITNTYETAIDADVTFTQSLSINGTAKVNLSNPVVAEGRKTLTWTIPSGTSGYDAPSLDPSDPDANKQFDFVASYVGTEPSAEPVNLSSINFGITKVTSAVIANAKYSGAYGDNISVDIYRTPLAKTEEERKIEEETQTVLPTTYQYILKVYSGTSILETFKIMQYQGKGYGDEPSLGETFDIELASALKQVIGTSVEDSKSKYIYITDGESGGKSDFHSNLYKMDHLKSETSNQYKLWLISLKGDAGTYSSESSIKEKLYEICTDYLNTTPSENNFFVALEDKYTYDFRFVTSAGICRDTDDDSMDLYDAIRKICSTRGDAFGVLDISKELENLSAETLKDIVPVRQYEYKPDSYIAYYCPWCYGPNVDGVNEWLPPSYWFLQALFENVNSGGQVYNPPAGVKRMRIGSITATSTNIGGVTLDELQTEDSYHSRINPIMNIRNYGYVVYGLRTAYALSPPYELSKKSALQQPHVRILANQIKAIVFDTALGLTFDNNNLLTWNSFVSSVDATLSSMQVNNALNDYEIIMDDSLQRDDKKVIYGSIKVSVFEAVEDFIIDFQLDPSTVTYGESTVAL